jgi:beta-galactosidase
MKDLTGKCPMEKLPGLFRDFSGTDVVDYTFADPKDSPITVDWEGDEIEAAVFNDILEPLPGAKVLGTYKKSWYKGKAALIQNKHGKGSVWYFGGAFSGKTAAAFLRKLGLAEPYRDIIELPECCEITIREKGNTRFFFVLNYSENSAVITLKRKLTDLYSGGDISGGIELPPFGTAVYRG